MNNSFNNNSVLITGGQGQLAQALQQTLTTESYHSLPKAKLDITQLDSLRHYFANHTPRLVLNTAAYTLVDKAESDKANAEAVNHIGAKNLAICCQEFAIPLLHLSTDYVFNGQQRTPYRETDTPHPLNYYGLSKLQGEDAIQEHCQQALILRISGVFSQHKQNFLTTMLRLAQEKTELRIVADQVICPTYTFAIADAITKIIEQGIMPGIYHYCSAQSTTWYEFATAILAEYAQHRPIKTQQIIPIPTSAYPTPAQRPPFSVLNCQKIGVTYQLSQPDWRVGIKQAITALTKDVL